jgi:hypothetical protein
MSHTERTPSRRRLLASATAALAAGAAIAAAAHSAPVATPDGAVDDAEVDAELLALCIAFMAEHAIIEAWNAGDLSEAVGEAANDRWWALVRKIEGIPAWTWEGVRAKARVADKALWALGESENAVDDLVRYVLAEVASFSPAGRTEA